MKRIQMMKKGRVKNGFCTPKKDDVAFTNWDGNPNLILWEARHKYA